MFRTRDSVKDVWGPRAPYRGEWPARLDRQVDEEPDRWVQSACVLCSNGCGMDIGVKGGRIVGVRGRIEDRVSRGRLGPKGLHGWQANNSPDRLKSPLLRDGSGFREISWDHAMALVVERTREFREQFTRESIGFYSTGQLFIEEYYTLGVIGKAGLGTSMMDGNTRLCTATAAAALQETFGSDGQPGSYTDIDTTDCIFLAGHNMSTTQTVLWMRVLDRLAGPNPPKLVVLDPRLTATAQEATVHLAGRVGANMAVLNGLQHLLIANGWIDEEYIQGHTVGFDKLREIVAQYPPERVEEIAGVPAADLRRAAEVIGTAPTLVSTVLQGLYQSHQATASACQVNNINLLRGMIGRPGCTVLQFNGQPTAQNTRETGCDGEFPAFRNPENAKHMEQLARVWNVDPLTIPHWHTPGHIMEMMRYAELGLLKMLWIICTNPAVSLPDLPRIRRILSKPDLFVIVQDAFMTETAKLADIVLPAALWGEKTGTFTNVDRTVHISHKAVDPPGEAKSDLNIFLDYARRMDFRDRDGNPLVAWNDPEGAFEAWKKCSAGCLCDYTGLTYEKLTGGSGIQWPCNEAHPDGTERLYTDGVFRTDADLCSVYGHDLETGAGCSEDEYRAHDPKGKAFLKGARYLPPSEEADEEYPFWLTTGRVVYQFHTRTKTGRSEELCDAAPEAFAQLHEDDAERLDIHEGDQVEIASRRGLVRIPAKLGGIARGHVFVPFHYGYWDEQEQRPRAANELTLTLWDPISFQPYFKTAAVRVTKVAGTSVSAAVASVAGAVVEQAEAVAESLKHALHAERPRAGDYIALLSEAHEQFMQACDTVAQYHAAESDVVAALKKLKGYSQEAREALEPFQEKYEHGRPDAEPDRLRKALFRQNAGPFGLLRDLQDLYLMANDIFITQETVLTTAQALRDAELLSTCHRLQERNRVQQGWLRTQIKHRGPHILTVPS